MSNIKIAKTELEIFEKKTKKQLYNQQYQLKNKEKLIQYRLDNRESIVKKNKIVCVCGANTETSHKKQHAFSFRHKNYINAKIIYHIID